MPEFDETDERIEILQKRLNDLLNAQQSFQRELSQIKYEIKVLTNSRNQAQNRAPDNVSEKAANQQIPVSPYENIKPAEVGKSQVANTAFSSTVSSRSSE